MPTEPTSIIPAKEDFLERLTAFVDWYVGTLRDAIGVGAEQNMRSVLLFRAYLETVEFNDPRLRALEVASEQLQSAGDGLILGDKCKGLLGSLGTNTRAPEPSYSFSELIATAVEDLQEHHHRRRAQLSQQATEAEARLGDWEESKRENVQLAEELTTRTTELAEARGELNRRDEQLALLRQLNEQSEDRPEPRVKKPRRVAVDGEKNVYRAYGDGDYEIGWTEDGKRKWRVIGPDLTEALAARDDKEDELKELTAA